MVANTLIQPRDALLTVVVIALLITSGCNGLGVGQSDTGPHETDGTPANETPVLTATPTATPAVPEDGTDLRSVSLEQDAGRTMRSELDGSDPKDGKRYYEPVEFAAEAGTKANITLGGDGGDPVVRLLAPNGTVLDTNDDGGIGDTAELTMVTLPETGNYTIIATSNEPDTAFTYYLTVDQFIPPAQRDVMFAGDPSTWNHTEQLGEFAYDYRSTFESGTNLTDIDYAFVNADENYVVVTYEMQPNASQDTRTRIDTALMLAHSNMDDAYRDEPANATFNESWTPDRVYHRAVTPDGKLYRVTYTTTEWARQWEEGNIELRTYLFRYFTTLTHGPAHQSYVEGANHSTATGEIEGRDKSEEIRVGVR
ncbi:PPC domain-containing protein [Halomicroarcula sp. F13]|uniref:PPC domain-containing protein n=1 Tax=Haloarcula rubra TaxID=2487747 RepID=A0AAW4PM12_9EURY|nr:PPC domain-containing protein [Halomicroarcula rubra]MBX0322159.1 PPC domain-containing protein [Halomicroarcula rubra]